MSALSAIRSNRAVAPIAERRLSEESDLNGQFCLQAEETDEVPVLSVR